MFAGKGCEIHTLVPDTSFQSSFWDNPTHPSACLIEMLKVGLLCCRGVGHAGAAAINIFDS